jgi:hypothetical protein
MLKDRVALVTGASGPPSPESSEDKNNVAQGWIQACEAIADSASVRVRFPD